MFENEREALSRYKKQAISKERQFLDRKRRQEKELVMYVSNRLKEWGSVSVIHFNNYLLSIRINNICCRVNYSIARLKGRLIINVIIYIYNNYIYI